jgi:hypothetical protein
VFKSSPALNVDIPPTVALPPELGDATVFFLSALGLVRRLIRAERCGLGGRLGLVAPDEAVDAEVSWQ